MSRILCLFAAAFCVSCCGCTGIPGSGVSDTETRQVDSFDEIELSGIGTLNISTGDTQSVSVTADDNLLELLETSVSDGKLKIRPTKSISPKTDIVIDVTIPNIKAVELSGATSLNLDNVSSESLSIEMSGACGADGSGNIGDLNLEMSGACKARFKSLEAKNVKVDLSGAGSATVFASESFEADVSGVGKITCHGNPPDVTKDSSGISKIKIVE